MISAVMCLNKLAFTPGCCKIMTFCHRANTFIRTVHSSVSHTMKPSKKQIGENLPWSYSKYVSFYSTLKHSIICDLTQEIDTEALKERCRRHLLMTGNEIHPEDLVQEELKMKFDQAIENFTEQEKRTLKIIQLEHSFLFSQGYAIPPPEEMTNENWLQAMTISTMEERFTYYVSLEDMKEQQISVVDTTRKETASNEDVCENSNSIFFNCENPSLEIRWGNYRLASAIQFGMPLIIDLDFANTTTSTELVSVSQQLWDMYCVNRANPEPFHLIFTSCNKSNPIYRHLMLHQLIKTSYVLATFTEKKNTDLFPRQNMVYLSSQSIECVGEVDPDIVYIIGAYHDPLVWKKSGFAKARQHHIRCLRLPISENVKWRHQKGKDLDINHVVAILLSVRDKMSWRDAFISHVPMLINQNS